MDWLLDFQKRFSTFPEIKDLKENKFHGSLEINFSEGISQNYNLKLHRRADANLNIENTNGKTEKYCH